jgi:hypothetical protein
MRMILTVLAVGGALSGCSGGAPSETPPPFKAVYSVVALMEGPVAHAAEVYWGSVSTIVDANGITEHCPQNDEEWEAVWAAGVTLAESGNLLMMAPRAMDDGEWMKWASDMVDVGVEATGAAESKNPDRVLEVGERVYNVCTGCHATYYTDAE